MPLSSVLMRNFLLVMAGWLFSFLAAAAPIPADTAAAVLRLDSLTSGDSALEGLLLDKGWRYQTGDNPAWARPDFDDRRWATLDPTQPRSELPPRLSTDISWLRLRFRLADSRRQRALLLQADGYGAWEIYLNGRLVQRSGTVRAAPTQVPDPDKLPPVLVPAGGPPEQVLAIRFAPWLSPLRRLGAVRQLLTVRLRSEAQAKQSAVADLNGVMGSAVLVSVFGLLTLLHLAFFRYYPAQRANLYFAFSALPMALNNSINFGRWAANHLTLETVLPLSFVQNFLGFAVYLWAVRALYALFGFRPGWLYRGLWLGFWVFLSLKLFESKYAGNVGAAVLFLIFIELLRLTGRALRRRQRGAWMVGGGFGFILVYVAAQVGFAVACALLKVPNPLAQVLQGGVKTFVELFIFLSPALGISLYLAREFALDSQLLQVKLTEVEQLSAQTLAQEQEKQALLASQNDTLEHQVAERTEQLQRSLTELRATQAQLVQREKMASLGELTAGIAHEIQNPLNFVNNFAEVSAELTVELKDAQAAGDTEEVCALADDLTQNLTKITEHGKRAAAIVRGMLEHTRTSTGERQPTDLNALADEYLRLAYQGLRAKDKSFNATLTTDFAAGLPLVPAVGADVGRVLLNLFTNAFYAVRQRQQRGEAGYRPTVHVSTHRQGAQVEIRVQDNGTGMPPEVQAKIFQPFFTTKPTGEGTGLGLSLSHDIIAQGHGGTLTVESQPGSGATFSVGLPVPGA